MGRIMRAAVLSVLVVMVAPAVRADPLYETRVIVSGMGVGTRGPGLTRALGRVLAKVSGDAGLEVWLPAAEGGVAAPAGSATLHGRLRWSDQAGGWVSEWRMAWGGGQHQWGAEGTSFDAAYRAGMEGVARLMAGAAR